MSVAAREEAHELTDREFKFICQLVYERTGIVLDEKKRVMVYRRLMRRTRELRITSFSEYCGMLGAEDSQELPNFINAITTNLTSFYRESHHFDYLRDTFIPEHMRTAPSRRLRVWSAACSTGEEPYTLAITLQQAMGSQIDQWDAKILATDLDTNVLATAEAGVYKADRVNGISDSVLKAWFKRGTGSNEALYKVHPGLAELISFKPLNLLNEWPMRGPFDVIMCRNVLIYFDRPTQEKLVERFVRLLRPGGTLMLGHSESVAKDADGLEMLGKTIYVKQTKDSRAASGGN